jgi:hypothetical protein
MNLPQLLCLVWGRNKAKQVVREYRAAFLGRELLLADFAKRCEVGAPAPSSATAALKQAAKQEVFYQVARILELKPQDFPAIVDAREVE